MGRYLWSQKLTDFHFTYRTTTSVSGMPDMSMREVRKVKLRAPLRRVMSRPASARAGLWNALDTQVLVRDLPAPLAFYDHVRPAPVTGPVLAADDALPPEAVTAYGMLRG